MQGDPGGMLLAVLTGPLLGILIGLLEAVFFGAVAYFSFSSRKWLIYGLPLASLCSLTSILIATMFLIAIH